MEPISLAVQTAQVLTNLQKMRPKQSIIIVEPVSTLIRLAMVGLSPKGTKISIRDNDIYINKPKVWTGAKRWWTGDSREDLHHLLRPIVWCLSNLDNNSEDVKILYKMSIKGLSNLKWTYSKSSPMVVHAINLYIALLKSTEIPESLSNADMATYPDSINKMLPSVWKKPEIHTTVNLLVQAGDVGNKHNRYNNRNNIKYSSNSSHKSSEISSSESEENVEELNIIEQDKEQDDSDYEQETITNVKKDYLKAIHSILKSKRDKTARILRKAKAIWL